MLIEALVGVLLFGIILVCSSQAIQMINSGYGRAIARMEGAIILANALELQYLESIGIRLNAPSIPEQSYKIQIQKNFPQAELHHAQLLYHDQPIVSCIYAVPGVI